MKRIVAPALAMAVIVALSSAAYAGDEKPKSYLGLSGFYAFNGYSQNNFFLGKTKDAENVGGASDMDSYAIQLFNLKFEFGTGERLKANLSMDIAQGIWGLDNVTSDRIAEVERNGGFSPLFNNKDTNFLIHVDQAYIDYLCKTNTRFKIGRMKYSLGNLLILDQDNDGVQITQHMNENGDLRLAWSKMSEGADALSDQDAIGPNGLSALDANLALAHYARKAGNWNVSPYYAYYWDNGHKADFAYLPQGLQYFKPRFQPQVTKLHALGFSADGSAGPVYLKLEADYLSGKDEIENASSDPDSTGAQLLDRNNGDLCGYNFYVNAKVDAGPGKLGGLFGYGSGDDDLTGGKGNVNKIRTNGYFYMTEIWEDSVMPDERGITPQGLGAPTARAYREFENTTALQLNYTWFAHEKLDVFLSGTYLMASQDIHAWTDTNGDGTIDFDAAGDDTEYFMDKSSKDLGYEIDGKITLKPHPGLVTVLRGGFFVPGDASAYLINGTDKFKETAWESRITVKYAFKGIKIGG